jgi:MoaA/NifB/PqqE/SkfB family radical SAM enzyme
MLKWNRLSCTIRRNCGDQIGDMKYEPLTDYNIMEFWLFDTCNFRCGYCSLVTTGVAANVHELAKFRDQGFISSLLKFFKSNRPGQRPWSVSMTGGEPMLMPNIDAFVRGLGELGDNVSIYTNMSVAFREVFTDSAAKYISYVEASFHPDWHMGNFGRERFFRNVRELIDLGIPAVVRFVGSPYLLDLLSELQECCRDIGVSLLATTLFNEHYPAKYTPEERSLLGSFTVGYSSLLELDGGLDMRGHTCLAGSRLYACRVSKGGDITPCISTEKPILGNVFDNRLESREGPTGCFRSDQVCTCDIHFQQKIVPDADDSVEFTHILEGRGANRIAEYDNWKSEHRLLTTDESWTGQGAPVPRKKDLLLKLRRVRKR